jgi:hypothetical protein
MNFMNTYQNTLAKLNQLPEPLLQEVNNFIDFLLLKENQTISPQTPTDNIKLSQDPDTFNLMQLAETGFSEWNDPEEDIYWTLKTSLIRADKIATVNKTVFVKKLGTLPIDIIPLVQLALKKALNLFEN